MPHPSGINTADAVFRVCNVARAAWTYTRRPLLVSAMIPVKEHDTLTNIGSCKSYDTKQQHTPLFATTLGQTPRLTDYAITT